MDTTNAGAAGDDVLSRVDATVPHSARIWNYWLGGKDNYEVDRIEGDRYRETFPGIVDMARSSRGFLVRAVTHLAGEVGVRQFLDIGTGLPTSDNTHEVAQRAAPGARIVYVDNDPLVLAHARALLTSTPEGATDYVDADLRDTGRVLAEAARTLDLGKPVALMLMGILGHIGDYDEARSIVRRLLDPLPSGSHLVLYDGTDTDEALAAAQRHYDEGGSLPYRLRAPERIAGFFDGLELLAPGVVSTSRWRPGTGGVPDEVKTFGGVGRKP
ncbi:S-adenosyl methyltransferase [Streptomyces carminius]|uniref:S-adenosyl methyltransferase n=1 Tax=Streptomyces carminius TaxID=2665496 RepID=A0A2M8LWA0_9ACTN|nr:SAM-dependent methyltransferase [Streptomyces carminius]PJE96236.1 S-adenosyl methyltransferase [Streptomyces carminius]